MIASCSSFMKQTVISSLGRQAAPPAALLTPKFYHSPCLSDTNTTTTTTTNGQRRPHSNPHFGPTILLNRFISKRHKSKYNTRPRNRNNKQSKRKKSKHPPQPKRKQPGVSHQAKPKEVPKALPLTIYQTASPHVFISACAIDEIDEKSDYDDNDDDDDKSTTYPSPVIHPKDLFTSPNPPHSFQSSRFEYVSPKLFEHQLPTNPHVPEVAFLGRSNVGKSSLINAVTRSKQLARISKRPGRTQQVNYFALVPGHAKDDGSVYRSSNNSFPSPNNDEEEDDGLRLDHRHGTETVVGGKNSPVGYLIDLPGYGYAKAPEENVDAWQKSTQAFIEERVSRGNLTRLYFLVDSRRGMNAVDRMVMGWMDEVHLDYTLVLTKGDCVGRAELVRVANEVGFRYHSQSALGRDMGNQGPFVHVVSSLKGGGVLDLMWAIDGDFKACVAAIAESG